MAELNEFKKSIQEQVVGIGKSNIPTPERDVLRVLYFAWKRAAGLEESEGPIGRVTQNDLAKILPNIGAHRKYERSSETTLRQVRQVIRDLRTKRWAPILSDREGYWLPQSEAEAKEYLERSEQEVKSRVAASFETYRAMKESLGISSEYFDGQAKLIDSPVKTTVPSATTKGKGWEVYRVAGQGFICTCPGFKYRKKCRHVEEAAKVIHNPDINKADSPQ